MNALISIIIPVYNVQDFLDEAIQSVLRQTYSHLELILVDDGSTDTSGKLCDDYAASDSRIRVIHAPNGGVSKARNRGLDIAGGDYIFFLDSDDYLEPDAIEHLYQNLSEHHADISAGSIRDVDEQGRELFSDILDLPEPVTAMDERSFWSFSLTNKIGVIVTCKLFKRSIWASLRFPEGKIHEDDGVCVSIMQQCHTIVCTEKICMNYRTRSGSIMHTSFSVKNLNKVAFLSERVNYFLDKKYYEYCYGTYFAGMALISKSFLSSESDLKKRAVKEYKSYRSLVKKLLPRVCIFSQKCYLLLFYSSLTIYVLLRYKLRRNS